MGRFYGDLLFILLLSCVLSNEANESDHIYKVGDQVHLYANKIGPLNNPSETYRYYDLSFCPSGLLQVCSGMCYYFDVKSYCFHNNINLLTWSIAIVHNTEKEALGEVLNGDHLVDAPFELHFRKNEQSKSLCKKTLLKRDVAKIRDAVSKDYYFQMFYDDLPFWGFIGKAEKDQFDPSKNKYLLFKHMHIEILYNEDRVIEIHVQTDPNMSVDITEDREVDVDFSYAVLWNKTNIPFEKRLDKYLKTSSMPRYLEIHWFSIINSCVTVLLLIGFLALILNQVYTRDEESLGEQEKIGWKYIHGDVFRFPKHKSLFAAVIGTGTQLLALLLIYSSVTRAMFLFLLALVGVFYPYNRGSLFTSLIVIYALTSCIAGYTASNLYLQLEGTNWVRNLLLTGCLFSGPLFMSFCFLNTVAIAYNATAALPFVTILVILLILIFLMSP